jgi:hypothetical protein
MTKLIVAFRNFAEAPKNKNEIGGSCGTHGKKEKYKTLFRKTECSKPLYTATRKGKKNDESHLNVLG